jgi:acetyl esterase/lipase
MPQANDIHPELRRIARIMPRRSLTRRSLRMSRLLENLVPGRRKNVESLILTSGKGVRLHRPPTEGGARAALLWIHGGGYVMGSPRQSDDFCQRLARRLGITIAAPQYGLAPEHPYPAAVEDCYAALKWLVSLPSVDPLRVAIGGESGGGGVCAALAFMVRDRGEISPVMQLLSYPMIDDRAVSDEASVHNYRLWNERSNRVAWEMYLDGADPGVAVPARRNDLSGLPPAWIGVGTEDFFHAENVEYARRLQEAGVQCHLEVVRGAFHGFDRVALRASVSRAYFASQCAALSKAMNLPVA